MSTSHEGLSRKLAFVDPATFTPHFTWKKNASKKATGGAPNSEVVVCEGVRLVDVAEKIGTPTYVYSRAAIDDAEAELHRGLGSLPHTLCFAVKSNGNLAILKHVAEGGNGFDIVSGGELEMLRSIGVRGDRIVFSGVGKTREEMREALRYRSGPPPGRARKGGTASGIRGGSDGGILLFNIESEAELDVLLEESSRNVMRGGVVPSVSIRVNPDVQAGGHPHIATGRHEHKFGLNWEEARRLYLAHRESKWIRWQGISVHIGSQIVTMDPFPASVAAAGWLRQRTAKERNLVDVSRFRRRTRSSLHDGKTASSRGVRANGGADFTTAGSASSAGARAHDHRSRGCVAHACRLRERESRQNICCGGRGDERLDAAGAVWRGASHYESYARQERRRGAATCRYRWTSLRDRGLFFARLAARPG